MGREQQQQQQRASKPGFSSHFIIFIFIFRSVLLFFFSIVINFQLNFYEFPYRIGDLTFNDVLTFLKFNLDGWRWRSKMAKRCS